MEDGHSARWEWPVNDERGRPSSNMTGIRDPARGL